MDWYAYLDLAKKLAKSEEGLSRSDKEARQRSAINRAYYAIFLTARDRFDPEYKYRVQKEQKGSSHANLWKQLRSDRDREMCRYIGSRAGELLESRKQADYDEFITDLPHVVADAIDNAEDLKGVLETFPSCRV